MNFLFSEMFSILGFYGHRVNQSMQYLLDVFYIPSTGQYQKYTRE